VKDKKFILPGDGKRREDEEKEILCKRIMVKQQRNAMKI
jgi:hypothetical protein